MATFLPSLLFFYSLCSRQMGLPILAGVGGAGAKRRQQKRCRLFKLVILLLNNLKIPSKYSTHIYHFWMFTKFFPGTQTLYKQGQQCKQKQSVQQYLNIKFKEDVAFSCFCQKDKYLLLIILFMFILFYSPNTPAISLLTAHKTGDFLSIFFTTFFTTASYSTASRRML